MSIINKIDEAVSKDKPMVRNKLKALDSTIDDFLDLLEDKAMQIEDNPTFQHQVLQLLADTTKEHGEFMMAMKRVAQALDSKSQKLGAIKPIGKPSNPYNGSNQSPQPDAAQPSTAGNMGGEEIEEMKGINESVDVIKRGKSIAQIMNAYTKDLERSIGDLSGRELILATKSYESLKVAQRTYIVELSKILKGLSR